MPADVDLDALASELTPVVEACSARVRDQLQGQQAAIGITEQEWAEVQPGSFRQRTTQRLFWSPDALEQFAALAEYRALEERLQKIPVIANQLNTLVGSGFGLSRLEAQSIILYLLPSIDSLTAGATDLATEERIRRVLSPLVASELDVDIVVPIQGLRMQRPVLRLADNLILEHASAEQTVDLLKIGLLAPMFASLGTYEARPGEDLVLHASVKVLKVIGDDVPPEARETTDSVYQRYVLEIPEELLQCLALMTSSRVQTLGYMQQVVDAAPLGRGIMYRRQPVSHLGTAFDLDDEGRAQRLQGYWTRLHDTGSPLSRAQALALRRLAFATQRDRPEDRLLDIFIAAEAFYLTDVGNERDRGELRYRLSLRAAVWGQPPTDDEDAAAKLLRREAYDTLRAGYDARSIIAHGGDAAGRTFRVGDAALTLQDLIGRVEEILRRGIAKALDKPGRIDWDGLILGI